MIAPPDLTTKAAEIRARLEGVQRQYACPYATISQDLLSQTLALIEQQAAELAEARREHRNIQTALAEETARTIAAVRERDEARASEDSLTKRRDYYRERMAAAGGELNRISAAIGSVRFMDPPDGGDVSLAEQVKRMRDALSTAESERDELLREKERLERRLDRLTGHTEMVMVNGAGFAAPKPVAQRLAELQVKLDQARDLGMAYSSDAKSAEGALITIRRRAIFGPGLSTSDLLDLTAGVAGVSCAAQPCIHAPTYDAGLCCGHPDDCTFVSPAALAPLGEE